MPFSTEETKLLSLLENRFRQNPHRHIGVTWEEVIARLQSQPQKLQTLLKMEQTAGEPDVVVLENHPDTW